MFVNVVVDTLSKLCLDSMAVVASLRDVQRCERIFLCGAKTKPRLGWRVPRYNAACNNDTCEIFVNEGWIRWREMLMIAMSHRFI